MAFALRVRIREFKTAPGDFIFCPFDDSSHDIAVLTDTTGVTQELIPSTESGSQAFDINASGQVLVYADGGRVYGQGVYIAAGIYLWQNGGLTPTNLNVSFDPSTVSLAFNDSAQIMGTGNFSVGSTTQKHAFLATNGVVTDLGTLPDASSHRGGNSVNTSKVTTTTTEKTPAITALVYQPP